MNFKRLNSEYNSIYKFNSYKHSNNSLYDSNFNF